MPDKSFVRLNRAVISVSGEERRTFLQGLISNDINKAGPDHAIWAGFLTAQGKFMWDLFIVEKDDVFLIDVEANRAEDFRKKLSMYKLRAKVAVTLEAGISVFAVLDVASLGLAATAGAASAFADGVAYVDPRLPELGGRVLSSSPEPLIAAGLSEAPFEAWDVRRIGLGVPDGSRDMAVDKALLLENGFDELGGVDFNKGCYMGQELTARTKYRGLIRKRLLPVTINGDVPQAGTPIMAGEVEAGELHSTSGAVGLAMVRLEHLGADLRAGDAVVTVSVPAWAKLPEVQ